MSPLHAGDPFRLQAGSAAIRQTTLCVQTVFDSIKYNTDSSNLQPLFKCLTIAAVLFYYGLKCILTGFSLPFRACWRDLDILFFWCVLRELRQFSLLAHLSHGMDKQLWGLSMFIALSEAEAPAPSSRAALSIL